MKALLSVIKWKVEGSCEQVEDVERKSTCLGGYVLLLARLTYSSSRFFKSNKRMCPRTIVFLRLAAVGYHSDTSAAWPDIFLLGPLVRLGSRVSHLRLQCECNISLKVAQSKDDDVGWMVVV